MKRVKITLLVALIIFSASCTFKSMYNQLDWLLPSLIEDFVTLDEEQQSYLQRHVKALLRWHRKTQLPSYASSLLTIKGYIKEGLTEQHINKIIANLEIYWKGIITKMAPDFAHLMLTASEAQIKELYESFDLKNKKFRDKFIRASKKQRLEAMTEKLEKNFQRWIGDLTDIQRNIITERSKQFKSIHHDRLQYRIQWQQRLKSLLEHKPANVKTEISHLFTAPEQIYDQSFTDKLDFNRGVLIQLILEIVKNLSKEQYAYLYEQIDNYARNFSELALET